MRRSLNEIAVLAFLFAGSAAGAQAQGTSFGVRIGLNRANVSSTQFGQGVESRSGFVGGVFLAFEQAGRMTFQPELLYSQKGFASLVRGGTAKVNLNYVEVPLLFKVRLGAKNRRLRPALIVGTFVAFEVGCSLSGQLEGIGGGSDCETLLADRGEMDAGLIVGAGLDYGLIDRFFLTADLRYSYGLLNLDWENTLDRVATRTWGLMVGAGVLLGR
ncbi:MAG: porin family protein [Gemmatimonadota bacterium]